MLNQDLPIIIIFLKILFMYFLETGEGRERGRETPACGCTSRAPTGDLAWNLGTLPRLGIEPVTLWFAGPQSIHWATPARADLPIINIGTFAVYLYIIFF